MTVQNLGNAARQLLATLDEMEERNAYHDNALIARIQTLHYSLQPAYMAAWGQFPLIETDHPPYVWMGRASANTVQILGAIESGSLDLPLEESDTAVASTWEQREQILLALILDAEESGSPLGFDELVDRSGLERVGAEVGLRALVDAGYAVGIDASSLRGFDMAELHLSERGRRAVGAWPNDGASSVTDRDDLERTVASLSESSHGFEYDVAVSYRGTHQDLTTEIVRALEAVGLRVWYAADQAAELWGSDLNDVLAEIFGEKSRYAMVMLSSDYTESDWTNFELDVMRARGRGRQTAYILPVVLDDSVPAVVGIPRTVGYVDARRESPDAIAALLRQKIDADQDRTS